MPRPYFCFPLSIVLFFTLFTLAGCSEKSADPSIIGVWDDAFGGRLIVSETHIIFATRSGTYGGEIVDLNQEEKDSVFQYTNAPSWGPGQQNRYNKLAWRVLDSGRPAIIEYSEGFSQEEQTTNSSGDFIAWPDAASVANRMDIFSAYSSATNAN